MDKLDKILDEIQKIKINQAVTHEKLKQDIKDGEEMEDAIKDLQKRADKHDTIFGGISMFIVIVTVVFGLILNSQRVIQNVERPKTVIKELPKKHN